MTAPAMPPGPVHPHRDLARYVAVLFLVATVNFMDRRYLGDPAGTHQA